MKLAVDIEANGLVNPTKIWCICCIDVDTGKEYVFRNPTDDEEAKASFIKLAEDVETFIGHNFLGYDYDCILSLLGCDLLRDFPETFPRIIDTLILSKLIDYSRDKHSIEDYGREFNIPKSTYVDYTKYSLLLEERCIIDTKISLKVYLKYLKYISKVEHIPSITLEHKFQLIVNTLHTNGFSFNKDKASKLLSKVEEELSFLDKEIENAFPAKLRPIREIHPRTTRHGTLHKGDFRFVKDGDLSEYNGYPFTHCEYKSFNPSSHRQIIEVLHLARWVPTDKTQTHIDTERELNRLKYQHKKLPEVDLAIKECHTKLQSMEKYGWKISEHNLETLPKIEPLILWKDKCRIKIDQDDWDILKNTIARTLNVNVEKLWNITIEIQELLKTNNSNEITEFLLKILNVCLLNKTVVAEFVKKESCLWSIMTTSQDVFVDCSASFVTDTWVGMRDFPTLQKTISSLRAARTLAKRILYESRRRTLTEWLGLVQPDGRIHGTFYGLGAWTHRMAHQKPNTANIPNEFDTNNNKKLLGKEMRSLWQAPRNRLLVGVDAEGIQLRIFAHYIDDKEFTQALVEGRKSDGSDPHSLNQRILGSVCKSRSAAKRFVYALLLGAGISKLAQILAASTDETKGALDRLMDRYQGWARLKDEVFPTDAKRGWLVGLDGRRVAIPGETQGARKHLAMSGYLQNGEAVVMKKATLKWHEQMVHAERTLDRFKRSMLVNFVHDEWQTETPNNMEVAIRIAKMQADSLREVGEELNLKCPLAGSYWNDDLKDYTIATNWSKTH